MTPPTGIHAEFYRGLPGFMRADVWRSAGETVVEVGDANAAVVAGARRSEVVPAAAPAAGAIAGGIERHPFHAMRLGAGSALDATVVQIVIQVIGPIRPAG